MEQVILDTNFILTAIRNKIDLFEELYFNGYKIIIPKQIINEIEKIKISVKKLKFRQEASLALTIIEKQEFKNIDLKGKNVDNAIINYAKENPGLIIATLDREIQNKLKKKNKIMIIKNKYNLEII
jgi:rRNA-processing protein FCF1